MIEPDGRRQLVLDVQTQVDRANLVPFYNESVLPDQAIAENKKALMHGYV
jgi:hypothetical protein